MNRVEAGAQGGQEAADLPTPTYSTTGFAMPVSGAAIERLSEAGAAAVAQDISALMQESPFRQENGCG